MNLRAIKNSGVMARLDRIADRILRRIIWVSVGLLTFLGAYLLFQVWDGGKNRGYTWGYWGDLNRVSSCLKELPGVSIVDVWYTDDWSLEEFRFDLMVEGKPVRINFGGDHFFSKESGPELKKTLMWMIKTELDKKNPPNANRVGH
jgi:hypothetical protein